MYCPRQYLKWEPLKLIYLNFKSPQMTLPLSRLHTCIYYVPPASRLLVMYQDTYYLDNIWGNCHFWNIFHLSLNLLCLNKKWCWDCWPLTCYHSVHRRGCKTYLKGGIDHPYESQRMFRGAKPQWGSWGRAPWSSWVSVVLSAYFHSNWILFRIQIYIH